MSEDNKKKLDQTFKATLSNEAHGVYFSLVSLPRAAGVLQNGLKILLKENIQVILFEIDCAIFYTNLHELVL